MVTIIAICVILIKMMITFNDLRNIAFRLEKLNLSHNQLRQVPEDIFMNPFLKFLYLEHNQLITITSGIGKQ